MLGLFAKAESESSVLSIVQVASLDARWKTAPNMPTYVQSLAESVVAGSQGTGKYQYLNSAGACTSLSSRWRHALCR